MNPIILPDPDQDRHPGSADPELDPNTDLHPFQRSGRTNYAFSRKFRHAAQNNEHFDTYDTDKKDKTMYTGVTANERKTAF